MLVLAEGIAPDQSTTSEKLLVDLGVNLPRLGNNQIPKKAPHEKYYWSQCKISFNQSHSPYFCIPLLGLLAE